MDANIVFFSKKKANKDVIIVKNGEKTQESHFF